MNLDDPPSAGFYVSADHRLLDMKWIVDTLLETYWGDWLTHESISVAVANSVCFGLYEHRVAEGDQRIRDPQIGFARVVTDHSVFSSLMDVVVDEKYRGRGLGKFLVTEILKHPSVAPTINTLSTRDKQTFYAQFGYKECFAMKRKPR